MFKAFSVVSVSERPYPRAASRCQSASSMSHLQLGGYVGEGDSFRNIGHEKQISKDAEGIA